VRSTAIILCKYLIKSSILLPDGAAWTVTARAKRKAKMKNFIVAV
jgi:hypothetical protein